MKLTRISVVLAFVLTPLTGLAAIAGPDPYLGEIAMNGANFCPRGWARADGQLLAISQNTALFSLYGTMYGGDGRTTFGLPDLRGRTPVHSGRGPGLSERRQGQKGGQEQVRIAAGNDMIAAGPPYLAIHFCVALQGTYPSRN